MQYFKSLLLCLSFALLEVISLKAQNFDATYSGFPDAEAVITLNKGVMNIVEGSRGYEIEVDYQVKIHILTEAGIKHADVILPFYIKNGYASITDIKARTLNVVDNKLVETPLLAKQIFKETRSENWAEMRFSMPNVKVGSIIEYDYKHYIRSIRLFEFSFQKELPVIKSQLTAFIPDFLGYSFLAQGSHTSQMQRTSQTSWLMQNLPAIKREAYVTGMDDYIDKIILQMDSYFNRSTGRVVTLTDSWESLTKEFFTEKYIGKKYNKDKNVHAVAQLMTANEDDPVKKLIILHDFIRDKLSYNGKRRIISREKSSEILEIGVGSSAAINLCLREMLAGVGIEAHPLLISTRQNGRIIKSYPLLTQFNHLICYAKIGEQEFFLDATNDLRPYDLLAYDDLNGEGWLLNREAPRWVSIPKTYHAKKNITGMIELKEDGNLTGEISIYAEGFSALNYRTYLDNEGEEDFFKHYFEQHIPDGEIISSEIKGASNPDTTFYFRIKFRTSEYVSLVGNKAYLYPIMMFGMSENPFLEPKREYPIDFVHKREEKISFLYRYPTHWEVDNTPTNSRVTFPNQEILMEYQNADVSGHFELYNRFEVNSPFFIPEAYPGLKKLFDKSISSHAEPVVFNVRAAEKQE
ncbi:MAG: DUF3857 domain-containing protein [Bacteroidia bacterium]